MNKEEESKIENIKNSLPEEVRLIFMKFQVACDEMRKNNIPHFVIYNFQKDIQANNMINWHFTHIQDPPKEVHGAWRYKLLDSFMDWFSGALKAAITFKNVDTKRIYGQENIQTKEETLHGVN